MILIEESRTDPAFHLAMEEYYLTLPALEVPVFSLWRNSPSVIIGRHQNALEEVNLPYAEKEGIGIFRRISGGGAVYHDLGNLNFTFIFPNRSLPDRTGEGARSPEETTFFSSPLRPDFAPFTRPVLTALTKLGLPVHLSGRNDLTLYGKKFSGNAQARSKNALLHHGTILFSVDLRRMSDVLTVSSEKFASHGVSSVESRVVNLADHLPSGFHLKDLKEQLIEEVRKESKTGFDRRSPTPEEIAGIEKLSGEKFSRFDWNIGKSPKSNFRAERRFPWGTVRLDLFLENGRIASARFSGDFLTTIDPNRSEVERDLSASAQKRSGTKTCDDVENSSSPSLAETLLHSEFAPRAIKERLSEESIRRTFPEMSREEFLSFLFD